MTHQEPDDGLEAMERGEMQGGVAILVGGVDFGSTGSPPPLGEPRNGLKIWFRRQDKEFDT